MEFHLSETPDGETLVELDTEGIDFLIKGLEDLKECKEGFELQTPSIDNDGVAYFILKRVADTEESL